MSAPLQVITNAVDTMIRAFEGVENAGQAFQPPEWITEPLPEIFHTTGVERFTQEVDSATSMLQELKDKQAEIAGADMSLLPPAAQADILGMTQRVDVLQSKFAEAVAKRDELEKQADPTALAGLNTAIDSIRTQISDAVVKQQDLNRAMQSGDISKVNDAYNQLYRQVEEVERGIRDNVKGQRNFNQEVDRGTGGMNGLLKRVVGIAAAYGGVRAIKGFFNQSTDAANETIRAEQRLQSIMANINGMTQDGVDLVKQRAKELEAEGIAIAASTGVYGQSQLAEYVYDPTNIANMTESMYNLATETYGANVSQDQLMQTANLMGKVMMGDINALSRNGFKIDAIFTEAEQQLLKTGTEAERAALVIQMIDENLSGLSQAMGETPEGQAIRLANAWGSVQEKIGYGIMPLIGQFSGFIMANMPIIEAVILTVFGNIIDIIQGVMVVAMTTASFIIDNWSWIAPIMWGIVAALSAYLLITNAVAIGTKIAAAAQAAYNAILNANPFVLIITLIIGVITALVLLWKNNDDFAAAMMRAWNTILNFFDQVPIFFKRVGNGITNIFQSMKVKSLEIMEDLINGVIDKINTLIEKLNKIPGVSIDTIGQVEFASKAAAEAEAIKQAGEDAVAEMQKAAADNAARREQNVIDAMREREEKRLKKEEELNKKFEPPPLYGQNQLGEGMWDVDTSNLDINKVKEVGKIKDTVDISSEDLKVMRDLAEMKTIQNFVTLTPTVQVTTGDIHQEADVEEIIRQIDEHMAQEIEAAARGVYE